MKKLLSAALSAVMAASLLAGCASNTAGDSSAQATGTTTAAPLSSTTETVKAPKYVFLFIGDGMSYPQFQAASDYLGTVADPDYM